MSVLLLGRVNLHDKRGGDTVQVEQTAEALSRRGVRVRVATDLRTPLEGVDVVHVFNLSRVAETAHQLARARRRGIPAVLTPIYQDLREYNRLGRHGFARLLARAAGPDGFEQLRTLWNGLRDTRLLPAALAQLAAGHRTAQRRAIEGCAALAVCAAGEKAALQREFGDIPEACVITLGVHPDFAAADPQEFLMSHPARDFVLQVGRIEDLKNQLATLAALERSPLPLVFVGELNPSHHGYVRRFLRAVAARDGCWHLPHLPRRALASAMAACRVHVLPSWVENVGLATLEAAAAGAAVVSTDRGFAAEYLGKEAELCDPATPASIARTVEKAHRDGPPPGLAARLASSCRWDRTAELLEGLYEKVAR